MAALLQPLPADLLRIWPVDRKVNKDDGPELLDPHSMPTEEPVLL